LAAAKLDKLWDSSMVALTESCVKTSDLLAEGKTEDAAKEFSTNFVVTMKKLYSEAAETYPVRFSQIDEWCKWTKRVYIWTRRTEEALKGGKREDAEKYLPLFREYFYVMHEESKALKSNDHLYAFHKELAGESPSADALSKAKAAFEKAEPSMRAKAESEAFDRAKKAWLEQVSTALRGSSLGAQQLDALRVATGPFYREFGIQFE
jgi:hypothetical protein